MILFGSRARGKAGTESDIDLIIVSPKFSGMDFISRGAKMYDYWDLSYPVDFICYTPEEFKKKSKDAAIVRQAVKEGITV
jgi:predicted nucleotidyltransferase